MTDPIHIDPEVMRTVANQHDDVADQIAPAREASAEILAAVNTFVGIVIQMSKKSYYASGAQYVGEIQVQDLGDKKVASLVVDGDPEDVLSMTEATFKINTDTGENPIVKP